MMNLNPMITKTGRPKPEPVGTAVLEQFAELDVQSISPETASKLLSFQFDNLHHERVRLLSEKAQQGTLTPDEQDDLDEYIRVGTLLGILQSRARQVLRNTGQTL
jgi:hypothetical protein